MIANLNTFNKCHQNWKKSISTAHVPPWEPDNSRAVRRKVPWRSKPVSFRPHYDPEVHSASNRHECQRYLLESKGGWCVGLTTFYHLHVPTVLKFWKPLTLGALRARPGLSWYPKFYSDVKNNLLLNSILSQLNPCVILEDRRYQINPVQTFTCYKTHCLLLDIYPWSLVSAFAFRLHQL
jgi:hypothetical protein